MARKNLNHDLIINSSGDANNPSLRINNASSSTFNHSIESFNSNLTSGETELILVGKEGSTKNSGYIGYYWSAAGSDDNYVSIGHWSADHLFRVHGSGSVVATTNMQAPIFYDSNNTNYYVNPNDRSSLLEIFVPPTSSATSGATIRTYAWNDPNWGFSTFASNPNYHVRVHGYGDSHGTDRQFQVVNAYASNAVQLAVNFDGTGTAIGASGTESGYKLTVHGSMHMKNDDINYVNQLHFNDNVRFYDDGNSNYLNFKFGHASVGGIKFRNGGGTITGFVYANSAGFGLLDSDSQWAVRSPVGGSGLELRSNNNVEFTVNDDHTLSHGSSRAPVFYDSNDTNYYVDPASTSNVNGLTVAGTLTFNGGNVEGYVSYTIDMSNTSTYAENTYYPVTIPIDSDKIYNFRIENALNSNAPGWSTHGSGFSLLLDYTTHGNGWGTHSQSRYIRLWSERFANVTILGGITQMWKSSNEVLWLRGGGKYYLKANKAGLTVTPRSSTFTASGQSVSPTTSVVNDVYSAAEGSSFSVESMRMRNYIYHADDSDTYFGFNSADGWKLHVGGGDRLIASTTQLISNLNFQAPIFHDSNDTGYYINPAGTSNEFVTNYAVGIGVNKAGSSSTKHGVSLYGTYSSGEPTYGIMFTGTSGSGTYGSVTSDWATYFTMNNNDARGWIFRKAGVGNTSSISAGGVATFGSSTQSPIFYDNVDTTYYLDPASSTTSLNTKGDWRVPSGIAWSGEYTGGGKIQHHSNNWYIQSPDAGGVMFRNASGNNRFIFDHTGGYGTASASWRAPIFYDSDDTSYYVDPNGNSQLTAIYYNEWIRNNRATSSGLYWESVSPGAGWHIYPVNTSDMFIRAGAANGSLRFTIAGETARGYVHWTTSNEVGFLNSSRSWSLRVDNSGNTFATTSHRAPIFYDSNNTGYYVNPAGRSNFGSLDLNSGAVWGATTQGTSKGSLHIDPDSATDHAGGSITWGASDSSNGTTAQAGIYVRSDGSYGTRMYLSTTDSYATGSKTTIRLEASGGLYVDRGNFYAPIFYDNANSTYYLDPAATGDSLRVAGDVVAYYSSDKRLKDNIKPIDNALNKVCSLSGNTFEWNEISHKETGKKDIGVVAQEVEEVFPEIVNTRDSGYKAVDYQKLSAVLIEAIKELKEEVEELKNKCNDCTK